MLAVYFYLSTDLDNSNNRSNTRQEQETAPGTSSSHSQVIRMMEPGVGKNTQREIKISGDNWDGFGTKTVSQILDVSFVNEVRENGSDGLFVLSWYRFSHLE